MRVFPNKSRKNLDPRNTRTKIRPKEPFRNYLTRNTISTISIMEAVNKTSETKLFIALSNMEAVNSTLSNMEAVNKTSETKPLIALSNMEAVNKT
jgi:hypothetical protein